MLPGHDVRTVGEMGWAGRRNGDLLRAAEQQFDAFITVDRNIEYQQNISSFAIGIVLLRASTNDVAPRHSIARAVRKVFATLFCWAGDRVVDTVQLLLRAHGSASSETGSR